ncbi:toll-like receptor 5 isoform X1 [Xyrichtys novacula]|uniref:Toll-like receptor 5 isoform X1 n=1 Tax=Xyrichtys novacula TaxID=13765 RepID=A0AAV1GX39_XYRNO|nr:toll-like receptor 5 isoform X1 [Xyrichtys novacula]
MKMRVLVVLSIILLQVKGCFPSCIITGTIANCASQNLRWVPLLPPHITHLYLEMNHISELNSTSLSGLEKLQELDLGQQFVPLQIRNNSFIGQQYLRKLVLGFNLGLQLEPLAFAGLSNLESLYLDYCSLQESILEENFLEPLSSLETLDLFGNQLRRIQPSMFFANMTSLKVLNLKLNKINKICEPDLAAFQGKYFSYLNLNSVHLKDMSGKGFDWKKCGNPFRGVSLKTLDLSYNGFNVFESEQFFKAIEGTKISHLKLSGPVGRGFSFHNLPDPDRNTFEGLKNSSIHILDLSKNRIFALQQGVFSPLREVAIIDVSQNRVNQIHRNAFEGLQESLLMLNLSDNLLGEIYSYTFASLTNLRVLDLSYNHIGSLGYNSFSGLPNLKMLFLTGNSLRDLGSPASLPRLDYLLLNDNKLTPLSVRSLTRFANNTVHLDIQDNRLTNLGDVFTLLTQMKRLKNLLFGGNTIKFCRLSRRALAARLGNFQVLNLHSSSLQTIWSHHRCLNLFDDLGQVRGLNLSFNALQSLPRGVFKGLTSIVELDLSSNALTYLQPNILPKSLKVLHLSNNFIASPNPTAFSSLSFLNLQSNRFYCDENLKSFLTWLRVTNVTLMSQVEEFRCEFPSKFYKVSLLDYAVQINQNENQV